jgi:hypothetical protein
MHSSSTTTDQLHSTVAHAIQNLGRLNTHAMIIQATNTTNRHESETPYLFVSIRTIRGRIAWNQSACCNRSQMIRPNGLPDSTATDQLHSTGAQKIQNLGGLNNHAMIIQATNTTNRHE